jgi:hypothetical protein
MMSATPELDEEETTIVDLQTQLEATLRLGTTLKQENERLKSDLDDSRSFNAINTQRQSEWRENWKKELDIVSKRESSLQRDEVKWKLDLEERRKELSVMESMIMNRQNVDCSVSPDHVKEMEIEHTAKMEKLTQEVRRGFYVSIDSIVVLLLSYPLTFHTHKSNKWREQFYDSRKSTEHLQAKCTEYQSQTQRQREISNALQRELSSLQQSYAKHIEDSGDSKRCSPVYKEDKLRDLKQQVAERNLLFEKLREEIKTLERDRDEAILAKDDLIATNQKEHRKITQKLIECNSKYELLQRKVLVAENEVVAVTKLKEELMIAMDHTNKELSCLQDILKSKEEQFTKAEDKLRHDMKQSEMEWKRQLSSLKSSSIDEQDKTKKLQHHCDEIQEHAMKHIQELANDLHQKDDTEQNLLIAQDTIVRLENQISSLQTEIKHIQRSHQTECTRFEHAIETCHQDMNLTVIEKTETYKEYKVELVKVENLQKELDECRRTLVKLDEEKSRMSHWLEDVKAENKALTCKANNAMQDLSRLTKEAEVLKKYREKAEQEKHEEVGRTNNLLSKEKRRSEAYKRKALEAHHKNVKAKELLENLHRGAEE